jgi:hypothetical protein
LLKKFVNTVKNTATVATANGHTRLVAVECGIYRKAVVTECGIKKNEDGEATVFNGNTFLGMQVYAQQVLASFGAILLILAIIYLNTVVRKMKKPQISGFDTPLE